MHNWELDALRSATAGFAESACIGKGGCAVVYRAELPVAPPRTSSRPMLVAIKKAIYPEEDHHDLDRELELLRRCVHAHLLPLVGYVRSLQAPCLIFPLMLGGSFEARLRLDDDDVATLRRLGHFSCRPKPLTWRQRLRILLQATEALLHLHSLGCVHRDFKPANILLQADLHAMLSDTGFAKAANLSEGTKRASITSRGAVHTTGCARARDHASHRKHAALSTLSPIPLYRHPSVIGTPTL